MPWSQDTSNFRCLDCGLVFTTEAAIEAHIQKNHSNSKSAFPRNRPYDSDPEEQAALPEAGEAGNVIDWMEEGGQEPQSAATAGYSPSVPGGFQPRPAFYPSAGNRAMPSPHDFRPVGLSPMVVVEYFCKVCGEIVPRLRFCVHMSGHFGDIYLPRTGEPPRCIISDFVQQGGAVHRPATRKEDCRTCAQGGPMITKLRQTLTSLAEVFDGNELH